MLTSKALSTTGKYNNTIFKSWEYYPVQAWKKNSEDQFPLLQK